MIIIRDILMIKHTWTEPNDYGEIWCKHCDFYARPNPHTKKAGYLLRKYLDDAGFMKSLKKAKQTND